MGRDTDKRLGVNVLAKESMPTYDEAFHVLEDDRWKRLRRDLRLATWLLKALYGYVVVGARIRRTYLEKKRAGQPYWLD